VRTVCFGDVRQVAPIPVGIPLKLGLHSPGTITLARSRAPCAGGDACAHTTSQTAYCSCSTRTFQRSPATAMTTM
jgi:hypothetical protein